MPAPDFTPNEMTPPVLQTDGAETFCKQQSKGHVVDDFLYLLLSKFN